MRRLTPPQDESGEVAGTVSKDWHSDRAGRWRVNWKSLLAFGVLLPAATIISATPDRSEVLVFVNQTVTIGRDAPMETVSCVRITLEKVQGRWLISAFDPTSPFGQGPTGHGENRSFTS